MPGWAMQELKTFHSAAVVLPDRKAPSRSMRRVSSSMNWLITPRQIMRTSRADLVFMNDGHGGIHLALQVDVHRFLGRADVAVPDVFEGLRVPAECRLHLRLDQRLEMDLHMGAEQP